MNVVTENIVFFGLRNTFASCDILLYILILFFSSKKYVL